MYSQNAFSGVLYFVFSKYFLKVFCPSLSIVNITFFLIHACWVLTVDFFTRHNIWLETKTMNFSASQTSMQQFTTVNNAVLSSQKVKNIEEAITKWIVKDCRPINVIMDEGFVSLMKIATGSDSFKPPCYSTVTETIIKMYEKEKKNLQVRLQNVASVSLTADFWTSVQNKSYVGVTVHYIDNWELQSSVLDVFEVAESHTAANCGETLTKVATEWEISDKVVTIVTDRGRNIVKGVEEFTPFLNTNCMAHIIQRGITASLKAAGMDDLLSRCRKIVGHFKHSALQTARLEKAAQDLQISNFCLIQDVATRWFSILAMAERLISQKDAIDRVLQENSVDIRLSDLDISRLETFVKLFSPLKEVSDRLGGQSYVTASVVVHSVRKLEQFMLPTADDPGYVASFKKAFSSYMEHNIRIPPVLKVCALLDPRYKKQKGEL